MKVVKTVLLVAVIGFFGYWFDLRHTDLMKGELHTNKRKRGKR